MAQSYDGSISTSLQALSMLVTHLVARSCVAAKCPANELSTWKTWLQDQGDLGVRAAIDDRSISDAVKLSAIGLASELQRLSQQITDELTAIQADQAQTQSGSIHP